MEKEVNKEKDTSTAVDVVNTETKAEVKADVKPEVSTENVTASSENITPSNPNSGINSLIAKIKSFGVGPIVAGGVVIVLVVAAIIFSVVSSTPKSVFKNTINNAYKAVQNSLDEYEKNRKTFDLDEKALVLSADVKLDGDIEGMEEFKDYTFAVEAGVHTKENEVLYGASVKGDDLNADGKIHVIEDRVYVTSSLFEEVIDITDIDSDVIDLDSLTAVLDDMPASSEIKTEDYEYIIKTVKNSIIANLNAKQMSKESAKFEVDGKNVKATKNIYEIDEDTLSEMLKGICEDLLEDDEFVDKVADTFELEKDEIKDVLKELKSSANDIELDDPIMLNIYTKGFFNSVVGFSVAIDEDEYLSIYKDGKNYEMIFDNHQKDSDYYSSKVKLVVTAVTEKDETAVTVKYNGEKVADLTIREMSDKLIDFDYSIEMDEDEKVEGTFYFSMEQKKNVLSGEYKFSMEVEEENISASGSYKFESKDSLTDINTDDTTSLGDVDYDKLTEEIQGNIENEDIKDYVGEAIGEIEKESLNLNYYNMIELEEEKDAKKLLSNKKATVLYVGDTYYSYSSDAYTIFTNLRYAQNDLDFYSYYLDIDDVSETFFDDINTTYTCEIAQTTTDEEKTEEKEETEGETSKPVEEVTTSCSDTPVIYLIKDGKVVKGIRGKTTETELKNALAEIGIE